MTPETGIDIIEGIGDGYFMPASTHRLDPEVQAGLDHLSRLLHRPKNRLINEAVKRYVSQQQGQLEQELEATLADLRSYRRRDPDFDEAAALFVREEAAYGGDDPLEGRPAPAMGATRIGLRRLLNA